MSVYIKGMEMPNTGEYRCVIRKWGEEISIDLYGDEELCGTLIPVPDHGRLIDADALLRLLDHCMFPSDMVTTTALRMATNWIKEAPTVIEADRGYDG